MARKRNLDFSNGAAAPKLNATELPHPAVEPTQTNASIGAREYVPVMPASLANLVAPTEEEAKPGRAAAAPKERTPRATQNTEDMLRAWEVGQGKRVFNIGHAVDAVTELGNKLLSIHHKIPDAKIGAFTKHLVSAHESLAAANLARFGDIKEGIESGDRQMWTHAPAAGAAIMRAYNVAKPFLEPAELDHISHKTDGGITITPKSRGGLAYLTSPPETSSIPKEETKPRTNIRVEGGRRVTIAPNALTIVKSKIQAARQFGAYSPTLLGLRNEAMESLQQRTAPIPKGGTPRQSPPPVETMGEAVVQPSRVGDWGGSEASVQTNMVFNARKLSALHSGSLAHVQRRVAVAQQNRDEISRLHDMVKYSKTKGADTGDLEQEIAQKTEAQGALDKNVAAARQIHGHVKEAYNSGRAHPNLISHLKSQMNSDSVEEYTPPGTRKQGEQ